jgi:dephospho-CoA kinase
VSLLVGLTGGIASGKSTVAGLLARLGCFVIDADALVAELYRPGEPGHTALVQRYGSDILTGTGLVDRRRLADRAFRNEASAAELNALIHPLVLAEERRRIAAEEAQAGGDRIAVVEATLLLEAGGRARYDRIVVVDAEPESQVARGVGRGMEESDVRRRMGNQMAPTDRLAAADYVIVNRGDLGALERETRNVYERLVNDLAQRSHLDENAPPERGVP